MTRVNALIVNLCVADLLVICFSCVVQLIWEYYDRVWLAGDVMCRVIKMLQIFAICASTNMLVVIAVDRHQAITAPLRKQFSYTVNKRSARKTPRRGSGSKRAERDTCLVLEAGLVVTVEECWSSLLRLFFFLFLHTREDGQAGTVDDVVAVVAVFLPCLPRPLVDDSSCRVGRSVRFTVSVASVGGLYAERLVCAHIAGRRGATWETML
ncbi:hypothetical protein EGW08_008229 [Elysia chlorotica]|uniref:G-protein coupled receptors family 1 profile domain-containing protein n=1 Tax=Elysia chlorotica TaxID=188477 RepID=A0A3S1BAW4_ELYCH|nr:hypothetical protein EGW08_008229 [Elysia chlorotica]